jgi:hypothetical protein
MSFTGFYTICHIKNIAVFKLLAKLNFSILNYLKEDEYYFAMVSTPDLLKVIKEELWEI